MNTTDRALLLDALLADPAKAAEVPREEAMSLLAQMAAVQAMLVVRVVAATPAPDAGRDGVSTNDMLTASEAAKRTGMSRRWLYAHADALPFARRISPSAVRFSARGIDRWLAARRP